MTAGFIPKHGGDENLLSYKKSLIVFDATKLFCQRFMDKRDRTVDQMVQAARSGKQNIIEGSMASGTSKESEIKLMNVARASLEELLEDYRDFLRGKNAALWDKNSKEALFVRKQGRSPDESYSTYKIYLETRPPETIANIIICLIHQANYLLDQQIRQLEQAFLKEGGLRERMTRARLDCSPPAGPNRSSAVGRSVGRVARRTGRSRPNGRDDRPASRRQTLGVGFDGRHRARLESRNARVSAYVR